jgi:hypothetical protein
VIHEGPAVFCADDAFHGISGAWVPRRVADLQRVYFDKEHFTARRMTPFARLIGDEWMLLPAEADKPLHALLREVINPLFTPTRMAALEDKVRGYARASVQGLRDRGGCEFLRDFCFEFPIKIFLELMGMPQQRTAEFLVWKNKLLHSTDMDETVQTTRLVVAYLRQEIADRRAVSQRPHQGALFQLQQARQRIVQLQDRHRQHHCPIFALESRGGGPSGRMADPAEVPSSTRGRRRAGERGAGPVADELGGGAATTSTCVRSTRKTARDALDGQHRGGAPPW